jgi:hypothetical protein
VELPDFVGSGTAESYLNRPGIVELREMDEQFYVAWP